MSNPQVSIVIPVYNEQDGLDQLFAELYPVLDAMGRSYEVLFVDDGSRDRSAAILREQCQKRPDVTRVILLAGNFGQHNAIPARGQHLCRQPADQPGAGDQRRHGGVTLPAG